MDWKKKIFLFLTSQAISLFGSSLVQFAIVWYITLKTESGMMMTISTLCAVIPQVLISLFAGVWADKYNKKMLIILSDSMIALSTLIIACSFLLGNDTIWLLFVVLIIRSFGAGIQTPTTSALIPEIVPEKNLNKINGINSTIQSIMLILSPAASGALLANVSLEYIFFIDVITAILGISIFSFIKINYIKKKEKVNYLSSIKEGLLYTKNHKFISRILIYLLIFNAALTPISILTPLYVTRTFGTSTWYLTWNEIVFFIGSIIGGLIISIWGGFKNKIKTISLGCIICGFLGILLGIPFNFMFYLVCMGLIGVAVPLCNTPFITLFQENVDKDKLGRIFSLVSIVTGSVMPISMIIYGPLADIFKIEYLLIFTGLIVIIATLFLLKDKVINNYVKISDKDN